MPSAAEQTISYNSEPVATLWPELFPLFELHYQEVATYHDIPLEVDRLMYEELERLNILRVYTVRHNRELVGYGFYLVSTHLHYKSSLQAKQDLIYIHPDHRRRGLGRELVEFADRELAAEGVQAVSQHVKLAVPQLGKLLEEIGYTATETVLVRRLDHGLHR